MIGRKPTYGFIQRDSDHVLLMREQTDHTESGRIGWTGSTFENRCGMDF
jgi:hypothetical protein